MPLTGLQMGIAGNDDAGVPRIGLDLTPLASRATGVGMYCRGLLQGFATFETGVDLRGYAVSRRRPEPCPGLPPCRHIPIPTRLMYASWSALRFPPIEWLCKGVAIVHAANYFVPPARRARRVISIHDTAVLTHPEWCSPAIAKTFAAHLRRVAPLVDAVLTPSRATAENVSAHLSVDPARIHVTPYGIGQLKDPLSHDAARDGVHRTVGCKGPFFLFVGTLEPRKNIAGLLAAFEQIMDRIPHDLVLAGAWGWKTEGFAASLERLAGRGRVHCPGYVDAALRTALYSTADALILPSWDEGFGFPVLEAMQLGCPVIASTAGALPEVVGDAGVTVDPADTAGLAAAMRVLAEDSARREALAQKGQVRAKQFTWRMTAEATLSVYRSLLCEC